MKLYNNISEEARLFYNTGYIGSHIKIADKTIMGDMSPRIVFGKYIFEKNALQPLPLFVGEIKFRIRDALSDDKIKSILKG